MIFWPKAIVSWLLNDLFAIGLSLGICVGCRTAAFHPRVGVIPLVDVLIPVRRALGGFSTQRYSLRESACHS